MRGLCFPRLYIHPVAIAPQNLMSSEYCLHTPSSSEPSGQWLLGEISLWKIKVKHVDDFLYRKAKQHVSKTSLKISSGLTGLKQPSSAHPRPFVRVGCGDATCGTFACSRYGTTPAEFPVVDALAHFLSQTGRCRSAWLEQTFVLISLAGYI